MDFLSLIYSGLAVAILPENLLYCFIGVLIGTFIGVLPGIGPTGAVAILLPVTFNMSSVSAIIMLAGIFYGSMYGGSTTSILVNIPGEAASVATCFDGYQMARQGRAGAALGIAAFGSFFAGILGVILLAFLAPPLARLAMNFGSPEYSSLTILGLSLVVYLGSGSILKALMMAILGIVLGCIGQDPIFGKMRLTYGIEILSDGLGFAPVIMGLFGISEVLINIEKEEKLEIYGTKIKGLLPNREDWRRSAMPIARGSILGFLVGILPGGTPSAAAFASYAIEKKISKRPADFGRGAIEGVAGPESANNATTMGSMVPLLTLGVPCNAVMALLFAALLIHGTPPGPLLIKNHPELFWGVVTSMLMGNVMLLALNLPLIGIWVQLLRIPYRILFPLIILFCLVGVYSVSPRVEEMGVMLFFGILGYLMKKYEYEGAPLILAFVLGPMMEMNLRQSLIISKGSFSIFFIHPISLVCLLTTFLLLAFPLISFIRKKRDDVVS
jgi:putative tricarboxylic transport membrane protein